MRTAISDRASIALAHSFYSALADGAAVDAALSEARKTLFTGGYQAEWGTPVLYMRAADGNLWRKAEKPSPALPRKLVLAIGLLVVLVAAGVAAIYGLIGPTCMDPGSTMNVAVTEVGVLDARGQMRPSHDSALVRGWIAAALDAANRQIDAGGRVAVWHDGLPRAQKRVKLGVLAGKTPDERAQVAEALAERIGADVVIYGHFEPKGGAAQFVQEFYVTPRLRPEANETLGRYQLGEPIPAAASVRSRQPGQGGGGCPGQRPDRRALPAAAGAARGCAGASRAGPGGASGRSKPICRRGAAGPRARRSSSTSSRARRSTSSAMTRQRPRPGWLSRSTRTTRAAT